MSDHSVQFEPASGGLELSQAILLYTPNDKRPLSPYGGPDARRSALATIHPISTSPAGAAEIGAGRPMTRADLRHWTEHLAPAMPPQILPDNVLVAHPDMLAWWIPEGMRPAYFNLSSPPQGLQVLFEPTITSAPYPAHLLIATRKRLSVFALPNSERPCAATKLLHSPILNVFLDGRLCWGNIPVPTSLDIDAIPQWEAALFDSWSTHPNPGQDATIRSKGGLIPLWDELIAFKRRRFPVSKLKPFQKHTQNCSKTSSRKKVPFTLADAINRETRS